MKMKNHNMTSLISMFRPIWQGRLTDNPRSLLINNIPYHNRENHWKCRPSHSSEEAKYRLTCGDRHTNSDNDHRPDKSLLNKEQLCILQEGHYAHRHGGTSNPEPKGAFNTSKKTRNSPHAISKSLPCILSRKMFGVFPFAESSAHIYSTLVAFQWVRSRFVDGGVFFVKIHGPFVDTMLAREYKVVSLHCAIFALGISVADELQDCSSSGVQLTGTLEATLIVERGICIVMIKRRNRLCW